MLLAQPRTSYADRGDRHDDRRDDRHYYHYHDRPHFGLHVSFVPDGYFDLWVGGARYYYYDGLYYSRVGRDYAIIAPPIGAVVNVIPPDYQPVIIQGTTYYVDNGIYYVYTRHGYQVVPQPVTYVQAAAPAVVVQPAAALSGEDIAINVPNDRGGYTPVTLRRSGSGFIGPQGEYYAEFPKVSHLKVLYGR
jgi:hypothetical protein